MSLMLWQLRIPALTILLWFGLPGVGGYSSTKAKSVRSAATGINDPLVRLQETENAFLSLHLVSANLDTESQKFSAMGWLTVVWTTDGWDPMQSSFTDITAVNFQEGEIWRPELVLINSYSESGLVIVENLKYRVDHEGKAIWKPRIKFETFCETDLKYFPFDTQKCEILLSSWSEINTEVILRAAGDDIQFTSYQENNEWTLNKDASEVTETAITETVNNSESLTFSALTFSISLSRKTTFYGVDIILPLIFYSVLGLLVFVLPTESGEKATFIGVTVLSNTIFFSLILDTLPFGKSASIFSIYLVLLMFLFIAMAFSAVAVIRLHHRVHCRAPSGCTRILATKMATITLWTRDALPKENHSKDLRKENIVNGSIGNAMPRTHLPPMDHSLVKRNKVRPHSGDTVSVESANPSDKPLQWTEVASICNRVLFLLFFILITLTHLVFILTLAIGSTTTA